MGMGIINYPKPQRGDRFCVRKNGANRTAAPSGANGLDANLSHGLHLLYLHKRCCHANNSARCFLKHYQKVRLVIDTDPLGLNLRLTDRYISLVNEHLSPAFRGAAGLRTLPSTASPMAATQAAWRFFKSSSTSLRQLFAPLLAATIEDINLQCDHFVLIACDWCNFHYKNHTKKKDRVTLSQKKDFGYEMFSGLAVSDRHGQPLGSLWQETRASDGIHSTHCDTVRPEVSVLDELDHNFYFAQQLPIKVKPVFIIDAEADSVAHMRRCAQQSQLFLIRADGTNRAQYQGRQQKLAEIAMQLRTQGDFTLAREVTYQQQSVEQWVAETSVVLTRAARPQRKGEPRKILPGDPLPLRLIVSELRDATGKVLAVWYLLTSVPAEIQSAQIALWYYWRWQIESFHKLLKSAGHEVEHWQQHSAEATARRLAVASMACLIVWRLQRDPSPQAEEARNLLVRLSGRQMHYGKKYTAPALLAGFWVLLSMVDILETYDVDTLKSLAQIANPWKRHGPKNAGNFL